MTVDIKLVREALAKSTPDWAYEPDYEGSGMGCIAADNICLFDVNGDSTYQVINAELAVNARNEWLFALCDEVEQLRAAKRAEQHTSTNETAVQQGLVIESQASQIATKGAAIAALQAQLAERDGVIAGLREAMNIAVGWFEAYATEHYQHAKAAESIIATLA